MVRRANELESTNELQPIHDWFKHQGWSPLPFQTETWNAHLKGESGLIQVPTGSGKTFAAVMGPVSYTHLTLPTILRV